MNTKIKGKEGENQAVRYLESRGVDVLERNFRHSRSEIDLIGLIDNSLLLFIEVKFRSRTDFGTAETFVSENQQDKIRSAADEYIHAINWQKDIRFDVITIDAMGGIEHFEDAFY